MYKTKTDETFLSADMEGFMKIQSRVVILKHTMFISFFKTPLKVVFVLIKTFG